MNNLHPPNSTERIGSFNNVAYARYKGKFVGETTCGHFAVPHEITTPLNPNEGNRTFVVEPPHVAAGFTGRDGTLGPRFLFGHGYSHVSVGYNSIGGASSTPTRATPYTRRTGPSGINTSTSLLGSTPF
jgi:hypothetical protein